MRRSTPTTLAWNSRLSTSLLCEVVGINSMIYSASGGYMGLSFAVPIDVAVQVANALRTHGRVIRSGLGVHTQAATPDLARPFGLKRASGALVAVVEKASPAEKAGIVAGDIVLMIDGKALAGPGDLLQIVGAITPGTIIKLHVWRRGTSRELDLIHVNYSRCAPCEHGPNGCPAAGSRADIHRKLTCPGLRSGTPRR